MKTQLKKIIIGAAALLFVFSGVSFAHDRDNRHHKPHRKAHGHYKAKTHHPGWTNTHFKPWRHYRDKHTFKGARHHQNKKHNGHWKKSHYKSRRPHHDRYIYKEVKRRHQYHHRRRALRENQIYKIALKDPGFVFKVIVKEHGLY